MTCLSKRNLQFFSSLFLALAVSTQVVTPALCEEGVDLFGKSLEEVLNMQVSTASKLGGSAEMAPGNVTIISQEDLRRYGYRTVGEAVQRVAGFSYTDLASFTTISLRGFSPFSYTYSDRVLVLIDGLRYNDYGYDFFDLGEQFPIDMESIDHIEVLRGSGSAVWGANALYGVINIITKDGKSDDTKKVMGEYGSINEGKAYFSWGDKTKGDLNYFVSGSVTNADERLTMFHPAFNNPSFNNGKTTGDFIRNTHRGNGKISYGDFSASLQYALQSTDIDTRLDYIPSVPGDSNYWWGPVRFDAGYKTEILPESDGEVSLRAYHVQYRSGSLYELPSTQLPSNLFVQKSSFNEKFGGAEAQYSQKLTNSLKGIIGTEWVRIYEETEYITAKDFDGTGSLIFEEIVSDANYNRTINSGYFDLNYIPQDDLSLFLGGRVEKIANYTAAVSPRIAAVYNPFKHTIFKLNYSQGTRIPTVGEAIEDPIAPVRPDPEKLSFYEAQIERKFGEDATVSASVFRSTLDDFLGFKRKDGPEAYYGNLDGFRSDGIELQGKLQIDQSIQGYTAWSYAVAHNEEESEDIKVVPHYLGRVGLSFRHKDYIIASPEILYGSSTEVESDDGSEPVKFDPFIFTNLTILGFTTNDGISISASIYNLFNDSFARRSDGQGETLRALELDRQYRLQATWHF